MKTIGLDFGLHQTTVCVRKIKDNHDACSFWQFMDCYGNLQYQLPSVICIDESDLLSYGYIPSHKKGRIIEEFKNRIFIKHSDKEAVLYTIWYITFILFDLKEIYNSDFCLNMGIPCNSKNNVEYRKRNFLVTSILLSAYNLIENVFADKTEFLNTKLPNLIAKTVINENHNKSLLKKYGIKNVPESLAIRLANPELQKTNPKPKKKKQRVYCNFKPKRKTIKIKDFKEIKESGLYPSLELAYGLSLAFNKMDSYEPIKNNVSCATSARINTIIPTTRPQCEGVVMNYEYQYTKRKRSVNKTPKKSNTYTRPVKNGINKSFGKGIGDRFDYSIDFDAYD